MEVSYTLEKVSSMFPRSKTSEKAIGDAELQKESLTCLILFHRTPRVLMVAVDGQTVTDLISMLPLKEKMRLSSAVVARFLRWGSTARQPEPSSPADQ